MKEYIGAENMLAYNRNIPPVVYHYCSMETFCKIITTDTLKLTNITKSNDPKEVIYIRDSLTKVLKNAVNRFNCEVDEDSQVSDNAIDEELEKYFDTYNPSRIFYAICFSESQNKLSQWEQYAEHSSGVAIGFNAKALNRLHTEESNFMFGPITYGDSSIEVSLRRLTKTFFASHSIEDNNYSNEFISFLHNTILALANHAPLFKSKFFSEEKEWRLVYAPKRFVARVEYKNFSDLRLEVDQTANEVFEGVRRSVVKYEGKAGKLRSYIELDFSSIRDRLIREIVLGPQADVGPFDLDLE